MMAPETAQYLLKLAMENNLTVLEVFIALADQRAKQSTSGHLPSGPNVSRAPSTPAFTCHPTAALAPKSVDVPCPVVVTGEDPDLNLR